MNALQRSVLTLAGCLALAVPAAAQQRDTISLEGRVLGPEGEPLAGQVVVLHRVAQGSGATIAADTSRADGRFTLAAGGFPSSPDATYFVAARYRGELYIGAPFRPPLPPDVDYTVQVGVPGTSATALMGAASAPGSPAPLPEDPFPYRLWILLIIPLLVVALATGYLLTRQRGVDRRRALLEIAELDEAHDRELAAGHVADSTLYWAERRALLERLRQET